jgi:hypothetical protein
LTVHGEYLTLFVDSLYNPHYGYFPKEAIIFSPQEPFDFPSIASLEEFQKQFADEFTVFEDALDKKQGKSDIRQLWHTPTELFQPHYGVAMARYMATNYKLSLYPYHDLLIYEMGAGNGTFMLNVLDYLEVDFPEVYERTKFKIIEISSSLADKQAQNLRQTANARGHSDKVEIINKSIFDWDTYVSSPCFFVALEVFDNFAHDSIRYDPRTLTTYQTWVVIDRNGELREYYESNLDPVALRFLRIRDEATQKPFPHPLTKRDPFWRSLKRLLPGHGQAARLTLPEYIPTRLMQFFDILHNYFPAHRLLSSDFTNFPSNVHGFNAPAVQTRFQREMIDVTTPLVGFTPFFSPAPLASHTDTVFGQVMQGYFDILFPTNFDVMEDMYRAMTGKLSRVSSQEEFLTRWAFTADTETRNGENPLLAYYKNAAMLVTM